ncbi:NUDIX hydrolase [Salibacterium aidingense]|uniref:NUDIX hydrolase n=1 Tax=Salibacterium aidingense TaxID=384933 RepID=UPI003BD54543
MDINKDTVFRRMSGRKQGIIHEQRMRRYAIFLPLLEKDNDIHLLYEVRAKHMKRQPGEVCFPGGMVDNTDKTPAAAAVRELCEEIGIQEEQAVLAGSLDKVISPFNQIIYPYVGFIDQDASYSPNEEEVGGIFTVPLSHFLKQEPFCYDVQLKIEPPASFPFEDIPNGKRYTWNAGTHPEYFYYYNDHVIWGLTAKITKHFLEELVQ